MRRIEECRQVIAEKSFAGAWCLPIEQQVELGVTGDGIMTLTDQAMLQQVFFIFAARKEHEVERLNRRVEATFLVACPMTAVDQLQFGQPGLF